MGEMKKETAVEKTNSMYNMWWIGYITTDFVSILYER